MTLKRKKAMRKIANTMPVRFDMLLLRVRFPRQMRIQKGRTVGNAIRLPIIVLICELAAFVDEGEWMGC